ncbi:hypothetical protein ACIP5Y_21175 [Nocardia sp. NPDC088792]|uniref:hypothetical protein n=1 Tax=Nocardia sp. NPDC088792 TaxID=3364332 RepID=UPI0037F37FC6
MSDTSDAFRMLLAEHRATSRSCFCLCGAYVEGQHGYTAHLAGVIEAEFLVVPRSDVIGTEYGWRLSGDEGPQRNSERMWALADAEINAGEAVQRPALAWLPITPVSEVPDA